ncbi:MAG: hypothetical protein JWL86_3500 [Rhizobium sp.]|nr:hypothetical protein [Rhizobium sp.]
MTNPNFTDEEEKPLDPAMEKIRRKMVRLLVVSSSVIILGLMAVVFSIVYKIDRNKPDQSRLPANTATATPDIVPAARQSITLPEGFVLESSSLSGNRILISGAGADGRKRMIVYDIGTGKQVTEIEVK